MFFLKKNIYSFILIGLIGINIAAVKSYGQTTDEIHEGKDLNCEDCHQDKTIKPESHRLNWQKRHGQEVRTRSGKITGRCSLCHAESSCRNCHQNEAPQNHTNHFRQRGHALVASIDREKCSSCHLSDYCERCHKETSPRSHTGAWSSPSNQHCVNCHFPVGEAEGCRLCHRNRPAHIQSPLKPANHTAGRDCRQCHGVIVSGPQRLKHADIGESCNLCHK